ncbi:MAG: hypothetical protein KIT09_08010 [Bryobacteraceae bacterium]|nr:hypothetical protein [Bryobacteraceae bacterium]
MKAPAGTAFGLKMAAAVALLAALSYLVFPGHTYLRQDSQIYVPILEHLWDPGALAQDPVAVRHHVTFTVWDELALAGRWISGLDFEQVLAAEHLFHRALGILGVFLIASAAGLSTRPALLVAGVYALGAQILGPAVLTVEYEPKPRASAVPLILLAVGCAAHGRYLASGAFGSLAFLYHPPTVYPFWLVFFAMDLWPTRPDVMKKRIYGLAPLALAAVALFVLSRLQFGVAESHPPLGRIDPDLEQLQRMRASYSWASAWVGDWIGHYLFVWAVSIAAFLRLRKQMPAGLQFFAAGLPLIGMLSMPASYLLLDRWKWALMPKFQPMRALLFVTAFAIVLAITAALKAASLRRLPEALLWGMFAFAAVIQPRVSMLLLPDLNDPLTRRRFALALVLAALAAAAAWLDERRPALSWPAWSAALVLPFFLLPYHAKVVAAEPSIETPELRELCAWARSQTPRDAVFLFPDAGRGPHPGVFRSRALRAIYVDWKSGGQVNMVKEFAHEWWRRWQDTVAPGFKTEHLPRYKERGIRYVVVGPENKVKDRRPVFENRQFVVYDLG